MNNQSSIAMSKQVAVISGDDAAPEAMIPVVALLTELVPDIEWLYPQVGREALDKFGTAFPLESKQIIDAADATLFGSTSTSSGAALMYLRWGKETFANVRPCKHYPGCASPLKDPLGIDFVIVRENLEDLYVAIEGDLHELADLPRVGRTVRKPVAELDEGRYALKVITEQGTRRIVDFACQLARKRNGAKKVTCVTKHNMLRETDGYFLEIAADTASAYEDLNFESYIVDDFACRLIREPQKYDVVVMPNLYGDILSDASGGLLGSLGLSPSGCYGFNYAYFEPAHGTAPDIAGQNIINPTATLLSGAMLLDYLGYTQHAATIEKAVADTYRIGKSLTPDQGGSGSTTQFLEEVRNHL